MLTKGIIIELPKYGDNIFKVRIPIFENASNLISGTDSTNPSVVDALLCYIPGVTDFLNKGDCVFVAFEEDEYSEAVILGKLFLNNEKDNIGHHKSQSINVSNKATLPIDTKIGDIKYSDIANAIKKLNTL